MQIFREKAALQSTVSALKKEGKTIGFVPTMGALHEGHLSLVKQAAKACDTVVISIFINPTQFDNPQDLINYPRTLESDILLLKDLNLNLIIFAPNATELYGEKVEAEAFIFDGLEHEMEGKFRSGHFNGVGTVVKKLFEIVQPHKAFFGEKDFQQLQIIRKLTEKANLPVEIIGCPIDREENGLARSSRNERLSPEIRREASFIYLTLKKVKEKFGTESAKYINEWVTSQFAEHPTLKLEYFEIADTNSLKTTSEKETGATYRAFIAAYAGDVRLIDNIALDN
ncbi:pantoate--beta-alanine ligase [Antarcticibacterium flavum]|uniref:Pantothenate synthetase n=1 Tax=Antarcticibacterium flavum TaxID=2058175 RepID=A0A5B7X578_9FLAO|nr:MULTISPECIES: pantoate--beta-alanine ligase [Antarcticibacterium]MCM4160545.1 pantoate--beta-alanine ligase [Antarcticibacterium sp. W02-3]QCY69793.1 pantoate--beta-alanine ligase [Antarcticibacterium flavum]